MGSLPVAQTRPSPVIVYGCNGSKRTSGRRLSVHLSYSIVPIAAFWFVPPLTSFDGECRSVSCYDPRTV
jgi:hypothetical protein